ncbi:pilus assembly protein FimV [Vibrio sp. ES.051]|uniref:FimV/HubP family polar landmark protein n=1 Tax=Vibrio sp. ES.051 TaxID=1761909 RepID=UPI000BF78A38|nr:FimV/HubP family polar landmark protein [Vibrio sp. ES.051]PFG45938.1 pilus assembly protein FimV [Vibrio sp. ES.051]
MRQNYKRLLAALVLMSATQTSSVVQAEGIRLVGPSGEVQSSPSYAEEIERALPTPPINTQPSRFFGPTGENQTLWSIATELRPSRGATVQQTLLAIYRINPQAFDKQNIHELIPGSRLRVPSLEQVQSATTEQAVAIMKAHEARLKQPKPANKPAPTERVAEPEKPQIKVVPKSEPPQAKTVASVQPDPIQKTIPVMPVPPVNTSPQGEKQVSELKGKLQGSQHELEALEEKNHRLRLMLSEVQSEVETLKNELNDEARIRTEVEKLLEEERQRLAEQQRMQPSMMDKMLSNGWLVGLAALIPGTLLAFLVVMLLGRRSKEKSEESATQGTQDTDPLATPIALTGTDELDEELTLDDDLFANDDAEELTDQEVTPEIEEDVFANLDDEELDFNLEGDDDPFAGIGDDGNLEVGSDEFESSSNGIKVNGAEKALGLEEMERALDEVAPELAVLDDETDFDLSDNDSTNADSLSEDAFAELLATDGPSEEMSHDSVDQALLDDLFAELGSDDLDLDIDKPALKQSVSEDNFTAGEASDDDIDKLLAQYEPSVTESSEPEEPELATSDDDISLGQNSTELLDELVDFDENEDDEEFDPLNELEALSGFKGDDSIEELDADSTDLLDELLGEDITPEIETETTTEQDPFDDLIREDEEPEQDPSNEEDLLASLGFDGLEPEGKPSPTTEPEQIEQEPEVESGLDLDALVSESQPDEKEQQTVETERVEPLNNNELSGELEQHSPKHDPVMNDLDDVFESNSEDVQPTEQESADFAAELDALFDGSEEPEGRLDEPQSDVEDALQDDKRFDEEVAPESPVDQAVEQQPQAEEAPAFTPTPNMMENEFGVPQEEDWLLDQTEPETDIQHEQEAVVGNEPQRSEVEAVTEAGSDLNVDELDVPDPRSEEDAQASVADESASETVDLIEPQSAETEPVIEAEDEFNFDELELPEFSEEDALASMADEPKLSDSEMADIEPTSDEDEDLSFDDHDLPEFNEEDVMASLTNEGSLKQAESPEKTRPIIQADNDHDALFDVFAQQNSFDAEPESHLVTPNQESISDFDESAMANLLAEDAQSEVFDSKLDSDTIASAGMDFETMLDVGDDWDGFKPASNSSASSETEEVPEDQRDVWNSMDALSQPEITKEDWAEQNNLDDFDPKKTQFMTIDELMAQVDQEGDDFEEEDLKLDVGLNEFPDVIGDIGDVDVDTNAEATGKLDLAKMYLEMNDPKGAIKLLEEAIVYGEDDIRREAKGLIDAINGR